MRAGNCIESLAAAFYSALYVDLPDITYTRWTPAMKKGGVPRSDAPDATRRPMGDDVEVFHFTQTWGSTTLGFGGMGGSAITSAYTTIVLMGGTAAVYFAGRHAYTIDRVSSEFSVDLLSHNMAECGKTKRYRA